MKEQTFVNTLDVVKFMCDLADAGAFFHLDDDPSDIEELKALPNNGHAVIVKNWEAMWAAAETQPSMNPWKILDDFPGINAYIDEKMANHQQQTEGYAK